MTPREARELEEQGQSLRRLARALVIDPGIADDAVQEAYVLALDRERLGAVAWLRGVVRNKIRERRRAEARRSQREQRVGAESSDPPSPSDVAAGIDEQRRVMECLQRVPEPFRTAVWMRYILGHEPQAIAKAQGIPVPTVRTRVHRGLEQLRSQLDAEHGGDRKAWQALLLPLLPDVKPPVPPAVPTGGVGRLVPLVGGVAATVVGVVLAVGAFRAPAPPAGDAPASVAPTPPPAVLRGRGREEASPTEGRESAEATKLRVHGTVRADGFAVPDDVQVYVIRRDAEFHTAPLGRTVPDADGRFVLDVPYVQGCWIAAVGPEGVAYDAVDGGAWRPDLPVGLVLRRPEETRVRVFDAGGLLVPSALIWVLPLEDEPRRAWPRPGDDRMVTFTAATDERGEAFVRVPAADRFRLRVRDRLPVSEAVVAAGTLDVALRQPRGHTVEVRLDGWTPDLPAFGGQLLSVDDPGAHPPTARFRRGLLTFHNVPSGRWRIRAEAPGYRAWDGELLVVDPTDDVTEASVRVEARHDLGRLRVDLTTPEGHGIDAGKFFNTGTWVREIDSGALEWEPRQPASARDSHVVYPDLSSGTYDVFLARWIGGRLLAGVVHGVPISAGQTTRIPLRLLPASKRVVPDLGTTRIVYRRLVHTEVGALPLLSDWTNRAHPSGGLPLEGSPIGPYPDGELCLELWDAEGERRRVPVPYVGGRDRR